MILWLGARNYSTSASLLICGIIIRNRTESLQFEMKEQGRRINKQIKSLFSVRLCNCIYVNLFVWKANLKEMLGSLQQFCSVKETQTSEVAFKIVF